MPEKHPQYKTILKIYKQQMEALAGFQNESGMWHQVLDHPETFEKTSCTAMFTLELDAMLTAGCEIYELLNQ